MPTNGAPYSARQSILQSSTCHRLIPERSGFRTVNKPRLKLLTFNTEGKQETDPNVQAYLDSFPISEKKKCYVQKRAVWHQPDDGRIPRVLSYMS